MATEYVVELTHWDRTLHLLPSPGGIPAEHTFQGDLIYVRGLEVEGRVHAPARHRGKRFRVWVSKLWLPEPGGEPLGSVGGVSERGAPNGERELLVSLNMPQDGFETASICLGASWKYLRVVTAGRNRSGALVVDFSFSRRDPRAVTGRPRHAGPRPPRAANQ